MSLILKPGDLFCTENPQALGKLIRLAEALPWRDAHKSVYSHSGVITDNTGNTVEELWTLCANNLSSYEGKQVIILRWKGMNEDAFGNGAGIAFQNLYEPYPFYRLILMLLPNAMKIMKAGKNAVCSERAFEFLFGSGWKGTPKITTWKDQDPQALADLASDTDFEKPFEGIWDSKLLA
jgi:hypothetical protein